MAAKQNKTSNNRRHSRRSRGYQLSPEVKMHSDGSVAALVTEDMKRAFGSLDDAALEEQIELGGIVRGYLPGEVPTKRANKSPKLDETSKPVEQQLPLFEVAPDWHLDERTKAIGRIGIVNARAALDAANQRVAAKETPFIPTEEQIAVAENSAKLAARTMYGEAIHDGHITSIPEDLL